MKKSAIAVEETKQVGLHTAESRKEGFYGGDGGGSGGEQMMRLTVMCRHKIRMQSTKPQGPGKAGRDSEGGNGERGGR